MNSRSLAVLALCFAAACGGSSDPKALTDAGSKAMNSGKFADAAKSFDAAVAALGSNTNDPEWMRAKLGGILARTQTDAARAKADFLELAKAHPTQVSADDFDRVADKLENAKHLAEGTEVLKAGLAAHPDSKPLLARLEDFGKKAESGDDPAALEALKGLGYAGDK